MAFKYVIFICSLVAVTQAGLITQANTYTIATPIASHQHLDIQPAVDAFAPTHQNLARSFDGTVSSYSKAIDTPYSSVHKQDTRISNNVYTPSLTKTVNYASPALAKTIYVAPAPTAATFYAQNALPVHYSHPIDDYVPSTIYSQASPALSKTLTYAAAPAVASVSHVPSVTSYSHGAPVVTGSGSIQSVLYSPAEKVSHISFDGFGTHWAFK